MPTSKDLRAQRATIWESMKAIHEVAEKENRNMSAEELGNWNKADADIIDLEARIKAAETVEERERTYMGTLPKPGGDPTELNPAGEQRAKAYATAFEGYMRRGMTELSPEQVSVLKEGYVETRDLGVGTGASGGFLVPQDFYRRLIRAQKYVGGVRRAAFIFQTSDGAPMPVPTDNDTTNVGELLTENTQATTQDLTVGSKTLNAYMYSSKVVKVSFQLLQDSAFNIDAWLAKKLGIRLGRIQNQHFTNGTGTNQPQGVVTAATLGKTGAIGQTTSIIYDDLVDLEHSVDPAYRLGSQLDTGNDIGDDTDGVMPTTRWMFADSTLKALKKIKDSQNRPLWLPGLAVKEPDTIQGYPYVINQDMPAMAANAKSVLFGDFSNYFIRETSGIALLRLTERYADFLQVGFLAFQRVDGALIDAGTHPISYYANSAT